jgi:hypothetical protein
MRMARVGFLAVMVGLVGVSLAAETKPAATKPAEKKVEGVGEKNEVGLVATLVADKGTYKLDAKQSGKEFREKLQEMGGELNAKLPEAPAVEMTLKVTNKSDKEVTISLGGDDSRVDLKLEGEGAVTKESSAPMTMEFRLGKAVKLAPGKSHEIKITSLSFGNRGMSHKAYWTEAGEYSLSATLTYGFGDGEQGKVGSGKVGVKVEK